MTRAAVTVAVLPTAPAQAPAGKRGADPHAGHCAACHGAAPEGQPDWQRQSREGSYPAPSHDVTGHTRHHGDGLLTDHARLGGAEALARRGIGSFVSAMPAFGDVPTDQDIAAVLGYIWPLWPPRVQDTRGARSAAVASGGN